MKDTNFDAKITDLKYHINGLVPETICQSFIRFFEDNEQSSRPEQSYKYQEKKIIKDVLSYTNGNKTKTAKLLKITRRSLYNKLESLNIE